MIRLRELSKTYDIKNGIFDLNLEIADGSSWAVIGPSGCGKTTLLHALAGLCPIDSGTIEIEKKGQKSQRIGLVQQRDALFPWLRVEENVALGLSFHRKESKKIKASVATILQNMALNDYARKFPNQLSGGQRQRVAIARTLVGVPDILLMDEPTAALDAFSKESLQNLILELQMKKSVTSIFVTHSIEEALFLGEKIALMKQGRIVYVHDNPFYPDPDARNHEHFYSEVLTLRTHLEKTVIP